MKRPFAFSGLLLASILLSACSFDSSQDRQVASIMGHHNKVALSCSSGTQLSALIVKIEYRADSDKLFAVGFDGNDKVTGEQAISREESCSFGTMKQGRIAADKTSKYYHLEHTWVALTKQPSSLCVNGLPSACSEAVAVLELRPNDASKLGTQAIYVLLDDQLKVLGTYIVPENVEQHFSNFYNRTS